MTAINQSFGIHVLNQNFDLCTESSPFRQTVATNHTQKHYDSISFDLFLSESLITGSVESFEISWTANNEMQMQISIAKKHPPKLKLYA